MIRVDSDRLALKLIALSLIVIAIVLVIVAVRMPVRRTQQVRQKYFWEP